MGPGLAGRLTQRGRWLSVVSIACILGWTVPALLMLDKGFAVEDEGTYVLAYRFWDSNPYFVSGAQYVYGPIFHALGESIPLLRLLRLLMVLGANLWFARCFLVWLERQRPGLLPAPRVSLVLLLTAAGGISYLWAPLTPGYYDLTADASLVLVSLMFVTLTQSSDLKVWVPVVTGVVAIVLLVTKWTALPVLLFTCGVSMWSLWKVSGSAARRYAVGVIVGIATALVGCQLLLIPLGRFITIMSKVSSLTAVGSHGAVYLARVNLESTLLFVLAAVVLGLPLLLGLLIARAPGAQDRGGAWRRWALLAAAVFTAFVVPFALGWRGGGENGGDLVAVALAGLLAAVLAGTQGRPGPLPGGGQGVLVALVLVLVPFAQAAGTNVPMLYVAGECQAMWMAFALMLITRRGCTELTSTATLTNLTVVVVATAMIAGSSTIASPFKTTGLIHDTASIPSLGVRLSERSADRYDALVRALAPFVVKGVTPVFAMDQNAGLTYLIGGVPAGSTWNDSWSPTRTAGILELACREGDVTGAPILLLTRRVDRHLEHAMRVCGIKYPEGYRRVDVPNGPPGLTVLVPRQSR